MFAAMLKCTSIMLIIHTKMCTEAAYKASADSPDITATSAECAGEPG